MSFIQVVFTLCWASCISFVRANTAALDLSVRTFNAPGASIEDTRLAIRRGLAEAQFHKRAGQEFKNTTTLDQSWNDAVLLKFGASKEIQDKNVTLEAGIEIICTTCYVKGLATVEVTVDGELDLGQILRDTALEVKGAVKNLTDDVETYFENYTETVVTRLDDGFDWSDLEFPTFNSSIDFNLAIPAIPEANLKFRFDGLELYLQLNTILSLGATYELPLFRSETPVGVSFGENLELGAIFSVDLILAVEGEVDISSGIHLKLDDGVEINLALFGESVSDIVFNGGEFEFLPVTIESAGIVFTAILRIGASAGIQVITPDIPEVSIMNHSLPTFGGGIEVGVFANVAEFVTNVTATPQDEECKLQVIQEYSLALGAKAGMTVNIGSETYGPVAQTSTPLWYTTLGSVCAIEGRATPVSTPAEETNSVLKREDLESTVLTTEITHTGVNCAPTVTGNCPVSLQTTSQSVETKFLTTAVPSGEDATWPASIHATVSPIAFGSNVNKFGAISGSPSSFVPPPPAETDGEGANGSDSNPVNLNGKIGGVSKKVIVGVSVGLGVPVLAAIIGALIFFQRRRRYSSVPKMERTDMVAEPYAQQIHSDKSKAGVNVTEVSR
ncbi:hypothetical protein BDV95DRAFT_75555 [Massariosphaeria phaeospora]|uniref:Mid2 domain-containing protein n=1 Tax=Massariosphaeria phaeospora TaxID=100035 RepID=A0A7C8MCX6_9PLEO|nr:hypothetical protein BDV95DRAFT_75555 [Massariosphaeria phaeospora]